MQKEHSVGTDHSHISASESASLRIDSSFVHAVRIVRIECNCTRGVDWEKAGTPTQHVSVVNPTRGARKR